MTKASKIKRTLCIIFMLFLFRGNSSEISQQKIIELLLKTWQYAISSDIVITDISVYTHRREKESSYGTDVRYLLHNGILRIEMNRGNGRTGMQIQAAPPACGWWYWHEDKTLFSSTTSVANKVIFLPAFFAQFPHLIYGMTLPERLKSGRYALQPVHYHGYRCLKLTAYYPEPDSVVGKIPISHFYHDQELMDFLDEILDQRYPVNSAAPANDKEWMLQANEYYRYRKQFKEYYIRKIELFFAAPPEKPLLHGYAVYDRNGRKLESKYWTLAEKPEKFNDDYFMLPAGSNIKQTTNDSFGSEVLNNYGYGPGFFKKSIFSIRMFFKSSGEFFSGIFTSLGMLLESLWIYLLECGWIIALGIAILSSGTVVTLKIKQYRK